MLFWLNIVNISELENFVFSIIHLKRLISISNVGSFKFDDKCLIPQLKVSLLGLQAEVQSVHLQRMEIGDKYLIHEIHIT